MGQTLLTLDSADAEVALAEAQARKGLRLLHLVIDVEQLSAGGASVSGLRARAGK